MRFLRSKKKANAAEQARAAREVANAQQAFFSKLPAELRNQIYEQVLPIGWEVNPSQTPFLKYIPLPDILHVCRQSRGEALPLFYGRNTIVITLQHMTLHRLSTQRLNSAANVLPSMGLWRHIRIESCSRCFHDDGFAILANVDVFIHRGRGEEGTVTARPRGQKTFAKCCQDAQNRYSKRLCSEIRKAGLHRGERQLGRKDFERLARHVDENKGEDNFMAPRRVIPSWSERTGRFTGR